MSSELKSATEGVRSQLQKWEKTLEMIEELLIDAEEKQLKVGAVRKWLENLQDLAFDAEDILDEYATEALTRKLKKIEEHQSSTSWAWAWKLVCGCWIDYSPTALWHDQVSMRSKIDGITKRLHDLRNQTTELGLVAIAGRRLAGGSWKRPPTTSLQIEPVVYGRNEDKAKIIKMVSSDEPGDANYGVVSIVGMGGLGKTTLAQEVYNDEAVEDFNPKGWVCVSVDFDVMKISIAILESITGVATDSKLKNLDAVQKQLKEKIAGRKFLLVLDDVWSEDYTKWQILRSPFMDGARGSKIIVTTRHERVALTMGHSIRCHRLLGLSDDDCWSLFIRHATNDNEVMTSDLVELIRPKVVEKCQGLPLAARTLGGLLRCERKDDWLRLLNSKTSGLLDQREIPLALQISYYHLPFHLKRCFAYFGIFPKNYQFEEKELILLWMAEGLIQQSNDNEQLEELGGEYFHDLLSRSIFQISSSNTSKFIMHDLINDLAVEIFGKLNFRLEDEFKVSEKTRYTSYLCHRYNDKSKFEVLNDAKHLRTHLTVLPINDGGNEDYYISNIVVSNLFSRFKRLRVLSLQGYCIVEVPDSIGDLRFLRHLNLSRSNIRSLPESINSLCNLQTLLLRDCKIFSKWPSNMGNLINLRHLDILGTNSVKEMPKGIRKWVCFRTLSNFIMGKDSGSNLEDLNDLKSLCGELHISRLENVTNFQQGGKMVLTNKKDLKVIVLEWGSRFNESSGEEIESRDEEMDKRLLDMLRPHQDLEKLTIKCYGGKTFSSWVEHRYFCKITILKLKDCMKCTSLPSLGLLDSLKSLTIEGMKELKSIDSTFYGQYCSNPFKSLKILRFKNLEKCESWDPVKETKSFPKLQELSIINCPNLFARLPNELSSLKKLIIYRCKQLVVSLSNIPKLCELELKECKKIVWPSSAFLKSLENMTISNISDFSDLSWHELKKVQNLRIMGCEELIELWQNEIFHEKSHQGLHNLSSLKKLEFSNCNALTTLLEGIKQKNINMEELTISRCDSLNFTFRGQLPQYLKKLCIEECKELKWLLDDKEDTATSLSSATYVLESKEVNASTSHLEDLYISYCPSLTCLLPMDRLFVTSLHISDCPKLTTLSLIGHLPVPLKHLRIESCSELTTLSPNGQFPETLETLNIEECAKLNSTVEKFHNNKALYEIKVSYCENLKSLPEGLGTLSNLKSLHIMKCGGFASFPKGGFPNSNLRVGLYYCNMLAALPSGIHSLSSLDIYFCLNLSLSEGDLPTKLTVLHIEGRKQFKGLMERGFSHFTSLTDLGINGGQDGESFQETDMEITLPYNLTSLSVRNFPKLKCFPFKDFNGLSSLKELLIEHCSELTSLPSILPSSLESLWITNCPELTSLPSILPPSLLCLFIRGCPSLKEACKRDKGKEWPKISDIPRVEIDEKFIYNPED